MKLLIFDFDGTIADTKSIYYNAIFDEMKLFGYKKEDIGKAVDLGLSLRKTLKNLGLGWIINFLARRNIMKNVEKYAKQIKKCKDVDSIKNIKERKILVSNSLKEFIFPVLKHLNLKGAFSRICGAEDFDDKTEFIKNYLKINKINKKDCFYIGDRVADVELAKKANCQSIIVSGKCAWSPRKEIIKAKPDYLVNDIRDIKEIVEQGQK